MTTAQPLAMAIGATDTDVGLVWSEQRQGEAPTLHFARLSPSLDLVAATTLADAAFASAVGGLAVPPVLAVAPQPSGWTVAGYAAPDLFLHAIDATGQDVGRLVVATISPAETIAGVPILAARPDGGPLVAWVEGGKVRAAVVAADGRSTTAPVELSTSPSRVIGSPSAIYAGSTFAVAFSVDGGNGQRRLRLVVVGTDGVVGGAVDALSGVDVKTATLGPPQVFGANDLTVVYQRYADACMTDQGPSIYAQRIGSTGAPLGEAVLVGRPGQYDGWVQSAAFTNGASVLLLRETGSRNTLGIGWVKPGGKEFGVASQIAVDPALSFRSLNVARRGTETVAAWLAPPRPGIRIARLTP